MEMMRAGMHCALYKAVSASVAVQVLQVKGAALPWLGLLRVGSI
jgi:hypothetical protein